MGPSGPYSELIYLAGIDCEGQISYRFTFFHKSVLVIMQGCTEVSKQGF